MRVMRAWSRVEVLRTNYHSTTVRAEGTPENRKRNVGFAHTLDDALDAI